MRCRNPDGQCMTRTLCEQDGECGSGYPAQTPPEELARAETVTPAGLRARADMVRNKLNDGGSCARHLELAADLIDRLIFERNCALKEVDECQQIAGRALGYPKYGDDQKNFPGANDNDGVCIGEHAGATIVQELANALLKRRELHRADVDRLTTVTEPRGCPTPGAQVTEEMRRVVRKAVYDAQPFEGCHDKDCLAECSPGQFRCQRFADKIATAALTAALAPPAPKEKP